MHTTNQGCRLFERSHSPLQFLLVLLCIPVDLELCLSGAILVRAHIQAPKCFLVRNYWLGLSQSKMETQSLSNPSLTSSSLPNGLSMRLLNPEAERFQNLLLLCYGLTWALWTGTIFHPLSVSVPSSGMSRATWSPLNVIAGAMSYSCWYFLFATCSAKVLP